MTTATLAPDALVTWGQAVLAKAEENRCPDTAGPEAAAALESLREALEVRDEIHARRLHPASVYPELAGHPEGEAEALRMAAEDIGDWARLLADLFPAAAVEPVP